jgi:hypothetical protein
MVVTVYVRHSSDCNHKSDADSGRSGCPLRFPRGADADGKRGAGLRHTRPTNIDRLSRPCSGSIELTGLDLAQIQASHTGGGFPAS